MFLQIQFSSFQHRPDRKTSNRFFFRSNFEPVSALVFLAIEMLRSRMDRMDQAGGSRANHEIGGCRECGTGKSSSMAGWVLLAVCCWLSSTRVSGRRQGYVRHVHSPWKPTVEGVHVFAMDCGPHIVARVRSPASSSASLRRLFTSFDRCWVQVSTARSTHGAAQ